MRRERAKVGGDEKERREKEKWEDKGKVEEVG